MGDELFERLKRLMPRSQDLAIITLKGHLLLEEQLVACLNAIARTPSQLDRARLSFSQRLWVVRALSGHPTADSFGRFIDGIAGLRNRLVHSADIPDLPNRVDAVLRLFYEDEFRPPSNSAQRARLLRNALLLSCAELAGFVGGYAAVITSTGHRSRQRSSQPNKALHPTVAALAQRGRG